MQTDSLEGFESLSSVQTKGVKKQLVESRDVVPVAAIASEDSKENRVTEIVGVDKLNRKRKRKSLVQKIKVPKRSNVVGLEIESSSSSEEDEEEDEQIDNSSSDNVQDSEEVKEELNSADSENNENEDCTKRSKVDVDEDHEEPVAATSHKPNDIQVVQVIRRQEVEEARGWNL